MKRFDSDRHRLPRFEFSGVLLVDKPKEWTSHDVISFVRSRFNIEKAGHCGTLDPAAVGLLVVVTGRFTKLSQKFSGEDKAYEGTMQIGKETDSYDLDGKITSEKDWSAVTPALVTETIMKFKGEQDQMPPMVSAVKKDGKRLYELARKGIEIERDAKKITINSIEINRIELPEIDFTIDCSKGTYIRSFCHDTGALLGCGAVLSFLRRTKSGAFSLKDAVSIDTLKTWGQDDLEKHMNTFLFDFIAKNKKLTDF